MGAGKVLANLAPGTLLIDSSTIDVATSRAMHAAAVDAGYDMLDAPVSGGVTGYNARRILNWHFVTCKRNELCP